MARRIESISPISYNSSKIEPVRNYTKNERKEKMALFEKNLKEYQSYLADEKFVKEQSANPENLSFKELLEMDENAIAALNQNDEDEGFELDIKS